MAGPITPKETIHNLTLLKNHLQNDLHQNIETLTMEDYSSFFAVFHSDFEAIAAAKQSGALHVSDHEWQVLQTVYSETLQLINAVAEKHLVDVQVPLVAAAPVTPAAFAQTKGFPSNSHVKANIESLEGHCTILPVKGDGHCLFRAVAASIASSENALANFKETIKDIAQEEMPFPLTREERAACEKLSLRSLQKQPDSDLVVSALRKLTCYYNSTDIDFVYNVEDDARDVYFERIIDMEAPEYGDEIELKALANLFHVQIGVIDSTTRQTSRKTYPELAENNPQIHLLYIPGHYDALLA